MRVRWMGLLGILVFVVSGIAYSGELSLTEAIDIAINQNPKVEAAQKDVSILETKFKEVRSNERPKLDFTLSVIHLENPPTLDYDLGDKLKPALLGIMNAIPDYMQYPVPGSPGTYMTIQNPYKQPTISALSASDYSLNMELAEEYTRKYTLDLQWPIWTGGRVKHGLSKLRKGVEALASKAESTRREITYEVISAYLGTVLAQRAAKVNDEAYNTIEWHVRQAESLFKQGLIPKYDLMRAKTELANQDKKRIDAHNQADLTMAYLLDLLSMPKEEFPVLITDLAGDKKFDMELEEAFEVAISESSDMNALLARERMYKAGVEVAKAELRPIVAAVAKHELRDEDLSLLDPDQYVGLIVKFPIFDGGKSRSRISQERAKLDRNKSDIKRLENGLQLMVRKYYLDYLSAQKAIAAADKAIELASESKRLAERRYEVGEGTSIEVTDALLQYSIAETSMSQAKYQHDMAYYGLKMAMGQIIQEFEEEGGNI